MKGRYLLVVGLLLFSVACRSAVSAPTGTWIARANMHEERSWISMATVGGKIYAIGGMTGSDGRRLDLDHRDVVHEDLACGRAVEEVDPGVGVGDGHVEPRGVALRRRPERVGGVLILRVREAVAALVRAELVHDEVRLPPRERRISMSAISARRATARQTIRPRSSGPSTSVPESTAASWSSITARFSRAPCS